jgi:hypothetical protein
MHIARAVSTLVASIGKRCAEAASGSNASVRLSAILHVCIQEPTNHALILGLVPLPA